ncbi:MAG: LysR family transcriptional regulator [Sakamotonia sp.]|jgi:LysR family cyn operon transcriptional activator
MEQHLSQYRIFYEVARCGNISRAAKELYISQPAISKAIGKLEESLGTRLFLRNSRGVQLTPEGNVLFQHVSDAFDSLNRGEKELKRIHDFHIGQLKIGVSNTLCKYVLLPYLKGFVEKYPHVNITIESQSTAHTLEMLEARKIDIGLVAEPRARRGLNFTPVMEIHDGFVCTPAYMENLTLREGPSPDIFKTGNIMLLDRSNMSRKHLDTYLSDRDIEVNQLLEVTDMALLIEFARIGLGIACVILDFVSGDLKNGTLMEVPLESPIPRRVIGFACPPQDQSQTLREFLAFCSTPQA